MFNWLIGPLMRAVEQYRMGGQVDHSGRLLRLLLADRQETCLDDQFSGALAG
jgi:hypothetical protein